MGQCSCGKEDPKGVGMLLLEHGKVVLEPAGKEDGKIPLDTIEGSFSMIDLMMECTTDENGLR